MTRAGEKLLTTALAAGCAVFFAVAVAMQVGIGRGYHWLDPDAGSSDVAAGGSIDREGFQLPPQSNFAVIGERPLFNEDRKPAPEEPVDATPVVPPSPLNISLTGTLLVGNPEMRVAMIRENGKVNTVALKEGMPLPGDQAAWTLSQVKKRSAIFKNTAGEEAEVELATLNASQKAGPARPGGLAASHSTTPAPPAGPVAQSEELQHRIEERRKQMREAAERMKAQQPPDPSQQPQQQ
jgi:general secretion pathway protein N